jgi:hypothetical protein
MRHRFCLLIVVLAASSLRASAQSEIPPFVAQLIAEYKAAGPGESPGRVWRYRFKGGAVFYVPPLFCCDIMSRLYDSQGKLLCHPDGGIAGSGDGKCPDFFRERSDEELLWSDGTSEESR